MGAAAVTAFIQWVKDTLALVFRNRDGEDRST